MLLSVTATISTRLTHFQRSRESMEKEKGVLSRVYLEFTGMPQESSSQANCPGTSFPQDIHHLWNSQSSTSGNKPLQPSPSKQTAAPTQQFPSKKQRGDHTSLKTKRPLCRKEPLPSPSASPGSCGLAANSHTPGAPSKASQRSQPSVTLHLEGTEATERNRPHTSSRAPRCTTAC